MRFRYLLRAMLAAGLVAAAVSTACSAAVAATATSPASVSGQGAGTLPGDLFPQWAGDPISFTIDAQAAPDASDPNRAAGTFHVTHLRTDGSLYTEFSGTVAAMTTAGQMAVVNGVITAADDPANPGLNLVGAKVAMTFDNRPDGARVGFVWGFAGQPVAEGQGAAPFLKLASSTVVVSGAQAGPVGNQAAGDQAGASQAGGDQPAQVPARQLTGTVTGLDQATDGRYTLTADAQVAAGAATTTAQGTFSYSLYQPDIAKSTSFAGVITCLDVGGDDAIATGQITVDLGDPGLVGERVAWAIYDNGSTDWVSGILDSAATPVHACQGPLPVQIQTGGRMTVTG